MSAYSAAGSQATGIVARKAICCAAPLRVRVARPCRCLGRGRLQVVSGSWPVAERAEQRVAVETPAAGAELPRARESGAGPRRVRSAWRRATRVAIALAPGVDFAVALHACLRARRGRRPDRSARTARARPAAAVTVDRRCAQSGPEARRPRSASTDAAALIVRTSGSSGAPKRGPADLRQLPLERDRLGRRARARPARALAVHAAAQSTSAASRSCCAARSTRPRRSCTSGSTPVAVTAALIEGGITLVSRRAPRRSRGSWTRDSSTRRVCAARCRRRTGSGGARRARACGRRARRARPTA